MAPVPVEEDRRALAAEPDEQPTRGSPLLRRAEASLQKVPFLKRVPPPALAIIALITLVNIAVWVGVAIVLVSSGNLQNRGCGRGLTCRLRYSASIRTTTLSTWSSRFGGD